MLLPVYSYCVHEMAVAEVVRVTDADPEIVN